MAKLYICSNPEKASLLVCEMLIVLWPEIKMFGFATGGTPKLLYGLLIQAYQDEKISFKDIYILNLDEYVGLDPNHHQSYAKYLNDIYCQVDIDMQKNRFPTCLMDSSDEVQKTCLRMKKWIEEYGPVTVWILGMGENGHFAFVEPFMTEFIDEKGHYHLVGLSLSTFEANSRLFNSIDEVPRKAITAGVCTVKEGKYLFQLAFGPQKAWAVAASVLGHVTGLCPSCLLQRHRNWILVVDEEAGKYILEYLHDKRIRPNDQGFYEVVSEDKIAHQVFISRDRDLSGKYSIPTETEEEKKQDLR